MDFYSIKTSAVLKHDDALRDSANEYFTSLFMINDGKFHASDLDGIPTESFVINGGIAPYIRLCAKLELRKNTPGFKIVLQKPMKAKYFS